MLNHGVEFLRDLGQRSGAVHHARDVYLWLDQFLGKAPDVVS